MKSVVLLMLLTPYLSAASFNSIFGFGNFQNLQLKADVNNDIQGAVDMIPVDQIKGIICNYIVKDPEVKRNFEWVLSDDFQKMFQDLKDCKEFLEVRFIYYS